MVLNCSLLFLLNISIFKNIIFIYFAFIKIINFWSFFINIFLRSIFKFIWFLITIWKIFEWSDLRLKIRNFNQRLLVQIIVLIKLVCFLTLRRFNFCTIILFCWKTLKTIFIWKFLRVIKFQIFFKKIRFWCLVINMINVWIEYDFLIKWIRIEINFLIKRIK
jgi:hypothetical protein